MGRKEEVVNEEDRGNDGCGGDLVILAGAVTVASLYVGGIVGMVKLAGWGPTLGFFATSVIVVVLAFRGAEEDHGDGWEE